VIALRTFDRLLVREFLKNLLFGFLAFVAIFTVVDAFEKIDTFIDHDVRAGTVLRYYGSAIPYTLVIVTPMAILLATFLTLGQLAKHNEIQAMKAAGTSLFRIYLPLYLLGLAFSLLLFSFTETIVPVANQEKGRIYGEEITKKRLYRSGIRTNVNLLGRDGRVYAVTVYDPRRREMQGVVLQTFRADTLVSRLDAETAVWRGDHWTFRNAVTRSFDERGEHVARHDSLAAPDLAEKPADFAKPDENPDEMNYWQLSNYIRRARESGRRVSKYLVDRHLKISYPLSSVIVLLIGTSLAGSVRRMSPALGFGLSLLLTFAFFGIVRAGQALGTSEALPPALAAWAGNLVFGGLGVALLAKVNR
jgi:lipopolysaccharide export system permease protein